MTITLEISPQIEEVLQARARESGLSVNAFVQSVIENAAVQERMRSLSSAEFDAALDELSAGSDRLPVLPPEMSSREGIYRDG